MLDKITVSQVHCDLIDCIVDLFLAISNENEV